LHLNICVAILIASRNRPCDLKTFLFRDPEIPKTVYYSFQFEPFKRSYRVMFIISLFFSTSCPGSLHELPSSISTKKTSINPFLTSIRFFPKIVYCIPALSNVLGYISTFV
ncbi:hypothetical protein KSS87_020988, partial [Heliosperma pusillum]